MSAHLSIADLSRMTAFGGNGFEPLHGTRFCLR